MIPTTNMILASQDIICVRVFIPDTDNVTEFATYLITSGWAVEIHPDVKEEEHPRITEEVELADGLLKAYAQWVRIARARTP